MDPVTLLIVAAICIVVGYIGGLLVSSLRPDSAGKTETTSGEAEEGQIRVTYGGSGQALRVRIDGRELGAISEANADQRQRLEAAREALHLWLGQPPEAPQPEAEPPAVSPAVEVTEAPVMWTAEAPKPKPTSDLANAVAFTLRGKPVMPASPSAAVVAEAGPKKSIIAQIDDILQEKLPGTPFADRRISLVESPAYGVVVQIDQAQYQGIDGVPDDAIRGVIRQAVAEWERR